jgi:hypothetical protein
VIQSWLTGLNPELGDRVPLRLMRENDLETVAPEIMEAARVPFATAVRSPGALSNRHLPLRPLRIASRMSTPNGMVSPSIRRLRAGSHSVSRIGATTAPSVSFSATTSQSRLRNPVTFHRGPTEHVSRRFPGSNNSAATASSIPASSCRWTHYGNQAAAVSRHARSASPTAPDYDPGAVLALVTWPQRDDTHWFDARIPDSPTSVEFVAVGPQNTFSYRSFDGPDLTEAHLPSVAAAERTSFLVKLKPAYLP